MNYTLQNKGQIALGALLAVSLVMATGVSYIFMRSVEAAALTSIKDVLSNPAPSTAANHTITFTTPTGVTAGQTITVTFPAGFNMNALDFADLDLADDGVDFTLAATASGTTWGAALSGQVITFTSGTGTIAASSIVTVEIGTNATAGVTGDTQVTNPSKSAAVGTADIYTIAIAGTMADSGDALVAVIEGVAVSVTVNESLSFSIAPVASGSCTGDSGTPTAITTTTTTVPFGTPATNAFYVGCHDLTIGTNAANGYAITGVENTSLKSGSTLLADTSCDGGTCTHTATTTWATNTNNGLGYACENQTGTPCSTTGTFTNNYRRFACAGANGTSCTPGGAEAAVNIMQSTTTASADKGRVHYKLSVPGNQAAGSYSNTITYVATPTY